MIARTNAALYSVEKSEDTYSVNMSPIALESSAEIRSVATGNGIIIVLPEPGKDNTILSVSTDGKSYTTYAMDFVVHDLIYSENMSMFIAVGRASSRKLATSADGITWIEDDWGSLGAGAPYGEVYVYYGIRESGDGFYLLGSNGSLYSAYVQFDESANYTYSNMAKSSADALSVFDCVIKGNERTIIVDSGYKKAYVQAGNTIKKSTIIPDMFIDGYFIRFDGSNIYKSLNAIDYSLVGATAYALNYICFYEGYYYGIAEGHVCRATSIAGLCSVDSTEYKDIENLTYSYVHAFEEYMLLCSGGFFFKTTIGGSSNPVTETITTISATAALEQSKTYTDEQIAEVIARIEALEAAETTEATE